MKIKYIQVNGNHKCIPWDSFLFLDNFAMHTIASLVMPTGANGYMNSYLRDRDSPNFMKVNFQKDFEYTSHSLATVGWFKMFWTRGYLMWKCFKDLFGLMLLVVTYAKVSRSAILRIHTKSTTYNPRVSTVLLHDN